MVVRLEVLSDSCLNSRLRVTARRFVTSASWTIGWTTFLSVCHWLSQKTINNNLTKERCFNLWQLDIRSITIVQESFCFVNTDQLIRGADGPFLCMGSMRRFLSRVVEYLWWKQPTAQTAGPIASGGHTIQSEGYFRLHEPFLFRKWFLLCATRRDYFHLQCLASFFVKVWTFDGFLVFNTSHGVRYT